jgi:glucan endo-1,3-beta-D-glucosidase
MRATAILSLYVFLGLTVSQEIYLGFNSGATTESRKAKKQDDFKKEFETGQKLRNSPGLFNSVRLYTNIQAETDDTPTEAFQAAIDTNTKLLLGIWCSGTDSIEKELKALTKAIDQYGKNFTDLVVGVSVGSEDLYRVSESGIRNEAGLGQDAEAIVGFIQDARDKLQGTELSRKPIGHVDTWSAWANESNKEVIEEVDFVGTNLFPYYENDKGNDFSNATTLFKYALNATEQAAGGKDVWVTETGWPVTGPDFGQAKATLDNAKGYWDTIGCGELFGRRNTWWYVLQDSNPDNEAKFGLTKEYSTTPQYNLTCPANSGGPASINNNPPSAGSMVLVSRANAVALALSVVFAVVAWTA